MKQDFGRSYLVVIHTMPFLTMKSLPCYCYLAWVLVCESWVFANKIVLIHTTELIIRQNSFLISTRMFLLTVSNGSDMALLIFLYMECKTLLVGKIIYFLLFHLFLIQQILSADYMLFKNKNLLNIRSPLSFVLADSMYMH